MTRQRYGPLTPSGARATDTSLVRTSPDEQVVTPVDVSDVVTPNVVTDVVTPVVVSLVG